MSTFVNHHTFAEQESVDSSDESCPLVDRPDRIELYSEAEDSVSAHTAKDMSCIALSQIQKLIRRCFAHTSVMLVLQDDEDFAESQHKSEQKREIRQASRMSCDPSDLADDDVGNTSITVNLSAPATPLDVDIPGIVSKPEPLATPKRDGESGLQEALDRLGLHWDKTATAAHEAPWEELPGFTKVLLPYQASRPSLLTDGGMILLTYTLRSNLYNASLGSSCGLSMGSSKSTGTPFTPTYPMVSELTFIVPLHDPNLLAYRTSHAVWIRTAYSSATPRGRARR